jgi:hypothetical protein
VPSVIQPTTLRALEVAIVALLHAQEPTRVDGQALTWKHAADNREIAPSMVPRSFTIAWSSPDEVPGGLTGAADAETSAVLSIVTDYRAIRPEVLGELIQEDFWDLHDWLSQRLHPEITGLMWIGPEGLTVVDEDAQRYSHDFRVQYQRAIRRP